MSFNDNQIIQIIKENQRTPKFIRDAREKSRKYTALIEGTGFVDYLIDDIEKLTKEARKEVRRRFAKNLVDVLSRVLAKRDNVFTANGSNLDLKLEGTKRDKATELFKDFKGGYSINHYFHENYFKLLDVDPNGIQLMEYTEVDKEVKFNPVYKSTKDIRSYDNDGQMLNWILFEPTNYKKNVRVAKEDETKGDEYTHGLESTWVNYKIWRFIDDTRDVLIKQKGEVYTVISKDEEIGNTFNHGFGKVPAMILSPNEKVGSKVRESSIEKIIDLLEEMARDKTGMVLYKYRSLNFKEWRIGKRCDACHGEGDVNGEPCTNCSTGKVRDDVSEIQLISPPNGDQKLPTQLWGHIKPDIETVTIIRSEIELLELKGNDTIWGTSEAKDVDKTEKTATAKFINTQPIDTKLHSFTITVQLAHNFFANLMLKKVFNIDDAYKYIYGTRYIIESPEALAIRYQTSKEKGDNNSILDKNLEELMLSLNKNNQTLQDEALKKIYVEPYVHMNNKEVFDFFGRDEVYKKELFIDFWNDADKNKDKEVLKKEFEKYYNENKLEPLKSLEPLIKTE